MARPSNHSQGLMPSLLDRLIDPESMGPGPVSGYGIARMKDVVRRDLEFLFNTHDPSGMVPPEFREVRSSVVAYGLPDLPWISTLPQFRREDLARMIEEAIARHEPRLREVRVVVSEGNHDGIDHRIRLNIEARLNVEPSPEVEFETVLELSTGQASIRPLTQAAGPD